MKLHSKGRSRLIAAAMVFVIAQLACGGVSPTDPRIPESMNYMANNFGDLVSELDALALTSEQPPFINPAEPGTVSGRGAANTGQATGQSPVKIRLYRVQLQGCGKEPLRSTLLGETSADAAGDWSINYSLKAGEVVAATQVKDDQESELSNLMVLDPDKSLVPANLDALRQTDSFPPGNITLKGSGIPGSCVILHNQDPQYGRQGSTTVDKKGQWNLVILVREGDNKFRVYPQEWENIGSELALRGSMPLMQWPYQERDLKADGSCRYVDTKTLQEPRSSNCYSKYPVTAWYGRNDMYVWQNLVGGFHNGIDIGGAKGAPVHAVADGEVFYVQMRTDAQTGGNIVLIDHGSWVSAYMHLASVNVTGFTAAAGSGWVKVDPPRAVKAGDQIGVTGDTGCDQCGIHLHFSAFRWANYTRQASLKTGNRPALPWSEASDATVFQLMNVNPPQGKTLGTNIADGSGLMVGGGESSSDRLADRRDPSHVKEYFSDEDYWDVDWSEIRIKEFGCAGGTRFDELILNQKGVWQCQ